MKFKNIRRKTENSSLDVESAALASSTSPASPDRGSVELSDSDIEKAVGGVGGVDLVGGLCGYNAKGNTTGIGGNGAAGSGGSGISEISGDISDEIGNFGSEGQNRMPTR